MYRKNGFVLMLIVIGGLILIPLFVSRIGALELQAAPQAQTIELPTIADARIQAGSPDVNFGTGYLHFLTLNGHFVFTQFDLMALPANAVINSAELQLSFTGVLTGPNDIEVGRAKGPWDENTLTWNNQPDITWGGPVQTVTVNGIYNWDVTKLVNEWQNGTVSNYGFALRGNGGDQVVAESKENGSTPPTLVITYTTTPPQGSYTDLGDAPDSSNHLGLNNTAYILGAISGRFPTVWDVPSGQVAGPRHVNATVEGILGNNISREIEADNGNDQDGINNILDGAADNADNDRSDDGWRNRNIKFFNCRERTLAIRVSKSPNATHKKMYLNVWFDGNRDGDWADTARCENPDGGPDQASYEWIVQDYIVDMTAVPAGGFLDLKVPTELVMNDTPGMPHWMRFTLSESRAVPSKNGNYPDGRGPHPDSGKGGFDFGETEDVLQIPPPPGEVGDLILEKRVVGETPVAYPGTITYQIRLRHEGGTEPIEAEIRDELSNPQHVLPHITNQGDVSYIDVTSKSGGASPLEASIGYVTDPTIFQFISWEGTIEPDSEVVLNFDVHIHPFCGPNEASQIIRNIAQAREAGGSEITAEETFIALCPGYDAEDIEIQWDDPIEKPIDLSEYLNVTLHGQIVNKHPIAVTLDLSGELETNAPGKEMIALPFFKKITIEPNESQRVDFNIPLRDLIPEDLALSEEFEAVARLKYCFVVDGPYTFNNGESGCPDAQVYPNLVGIGGPININVSPNDLGDAPDSSNHFAVAMAAYPAVQAAYPTVFDPATGLPQGPKHLRPRPFHLGPQVSREAEADFGPDADPFNNIVPPANNPDNDRFDDGVNPNLWTFNNCQTATIPVRIFISPQAVNWFQQKEQLAYVNVWIDANRDGDWADGFNCGANQAEVEHIVIDFPVDVVSLGAGLQVINVPTGLTPWPNQWAQQPYWARVTLSEEKSNQTLLFGNISYSDGRGFADPFQTGETEDYLAFPQGAEDAGPDAAVAVAGEVTWDISKVSGITQKVRFKIDYSNLGSEPASDARLTFQIPSALQNMQPEIIQAPEIPNTNIQIDSDQIIFSLPQIEKDNFIVLGWQVDVGNGHPGSYEASAQIIVDGDLDLSNNQAEVSLVPSLGEPLVALRTAAGNRWGSEEATCRTDVEIAIMGVPGQSITIFVDDQPVGTTMLEEDPVYYPLQNLSIGQHHITAQYGSAQIVSPRDASTGMPAGVVIEVDPSLPIDPLSISFTDNQDQTFHPSTLGFSWSSSQSAIFLVGGEHYEVGVDTCSDELNQRIVITSDDHDELLYDKDGDGRYTGSFTYNPTVRNTVNASSLSFRVNAAGAQQHFEMALNSLVQGTVRDALTQQPLSNAHVTALGISSTTSGASLYSALPQTALGQPNPQETDADGQYSFTVPGDLKRLDVESAGYQRYRSWNLVPENGLLAPNIYLTPEVPGPVDLTIFITDQGFSPAIVSVNPGSIIEWVNVDLMEHTVAGDSWDSGVLESGQSYKVRMDEPGSYSVVDSANPQNTAAIIVDGLGSQMAFLPMIGR